MVGNPEVESGARSGLSLPQFLRGSALSLHCLCVRHPGGPGWGGGCHSWVCHGGPWPLQVSRHMNCTFPPQLQGAIMVASCVQMLVGFSGLIGFLMRFIGPLTIAPTISLVALPLFDSAGNNAGIHWGIAAM